MKKAVSLLLFLLTIVAFPVYSYCQSEVGYLIIDNTKTPWGHRFYAVFSQIWKPPEGISDYYIEIDEVKPTRKQSWIVVKVGDKIYMKPVYAKLLHPTTSDFDMGRYAVDAAKKVLVFLLTDYQKIKQMEKEL